jgi:hypothetical protein
MATNDPSEAVQLGIWQVLKNDPALTALVRHVLDAEPDAQDYPYVVVDELSSVFDGTHDDPGRRVEVAIHTYVQGEVRGRNERLDNKIGARIMELTDRAHRELDPFVADHTVWMTRHLTNRRVPEADRLTRHRVDIVRVWTTNT